ncbi:hypothetical protein [Scandinavium manionii]|uniref:hypothetical protein n=1 Tax=Scandinavium manionii TaxID=2926520 RepID=UPI0021652B09|nr:hypothetical protein [Scandinavium manionii]MCS2164035.1 hypothetical protein [Scandinavium manionii]
MARYRVGNRYLSQEEFDAEQDWKWMVGLFLVGAVITGYLIHLYVVNPAWHDAIRFIVTVTPSIAAGYLLARFRAFIIALLGLAVALLVISVVISILIKMV